MTIYTQKLLLDSAFFLGSLALCALLAFMETSITAIRLFKVKELQKSVPKYQLFFKTLETDPQYVLMTVLIATNMMAITTAILLQNIIENIFADFDLPQGLGFTLGIAIGTIVVSLIGEIIPKSIAQALDNSFVSLLWLANSIFYILGPIARPLTNISRNIARKKYDYETHIISEQEIRFLISHIEKKGLMEQDKTHMLQNIFRIENTHVKEILIPKSDIVSIGIKATLDEILDLFKSCQFSRVPIFKDNPENIIGIIYQKDLFLSLQANNNFFDINKLIKPIIFVPDSLKVSELLKEFKKQHIHMAMVLDEYGSTIGLVTLEDTLEEIVGDITDEHERMQNFHKIITIMPDQEWLVDAMIDLDRLEEIFQITFEAETALTLGGFLTEYAQKLLKKGESIFYQGFCFIVQEANDKRILLVQIKRSEIRNECIPAKNNKD
ncbi:HlyC/CorC family transporter [Candidatus Dependentiae bacterium]|nr:HlyC/CorC family transporter [Candidatus Dependentiae bacterium]